MASGQDYFIHGLQVRIEMSHDPFRGQMQKFLKGFTDRNRPSLSASNGITGIIRRFSQDEVARSVVPEATRLCTSDSLLEIYGHGERYWLVDDAWGISEINLLKRQWRSWVFPAVATDDVHFFESAMLWPMAQLMRPRGLELIPAVAVENNGFGALIISHYGIGREIERMLASGYRLVSQRWSALRILGQRIAMHSFPGAVQIARLPVPRRELFNLETPWIDLCDKYPAHIAQQSWCHAVFIIHPGRRSVSRGQEYTGDDAAALLKRAWPTQDLTSPTHRLTLAASHLARQCQVYRLELSHRPDDLVKIMEQVRMRSSRPRVEVKIPADLRRFSRSLSAHRLHHSRAR